MGRTVGGGSGEPIRSDGIGRADSTSEGWTAGDGGAACLNQQPLETAASRTPITSAAQRVEEVKGPRIVRGPFIIDLLRLSYSTRLISTGTVSAVGAVGGLSSSSPKYV